MPPQLATIGYEKASLADFIVALKAAGVRVLVDVRAVPHSRRRDFAARFLAPALEQEGISYVHLPALGAPKPGRDAARAGNRAGFEKIMQEHLGGTEAQADLARLADLAADGKVCLMCLEADPEQCHRSLVAAHISRRMDVTVRHLRVGAGSAGQAQLPLDGH